MNQKTVLVVDDEESVKFLYNRMYKKEIRSGLFYLEFSNSGEEAIKKVKSNQIDNLQLIISDINMPGMSGFELLKELKEFAPELPIFMSSAYTDSERQAHAKELGALDYITKPVDFKILKEKISKILDSDEN